MSLGLILFILSLLSFVGLAVYYRKKIKWFFKKHNITWKKIVAVLTGGLLVAGSIVYLSPSPAPPGAFISTENLGYELLDNNEVLYIWNQYNDYYFNVSNGIQFSNHYLEYWTTNVLMLGYYNGDDWNLIYRTDELSGFTKDITGETDGYINATIWKDLSYGSYDFRLAIRYYLGVNDSDLTIIPYIKNLGQAIPYVLGFGWEMKDIQIDATPENDYININRTGYYLNQTLDNTYTNLSFPIFNESGNITGWTNPKFEICENITDNRGKYLYLTWDRNLTYRVTVKNRTGQYNAPTTLFVRVGTLGVDQEKFTKMHWLDADTITFYFNNYDIFEAWATNPADMVDGDENDYASTGSVNDVEYLISNTWVDEEPGDISLVELRCKGYHSSLNSADIHLRPVFEGGDGDDHIFDAPLSFPAWSDWFDIMRDPNVPELWSWELIGDLDCDVVAVPPLEYPFTLLCSQVEIRVTYTIPPNVPPVQSNQKIWNATTSTEWSLNATEVSLMPTCFNVTVNDTDADYMNVTILTNESGSWTVVNQTASGMLNGTYNGYNTSWVDSYSTQYWISFNVSDDSDWTNETYNFTTVVEEAGYYNTTVRVTGEDYFIWMGSNVSAFHVVQNLTTGGAVFDESNEYVSIWNESGTWNADWYVNGTWYEYHPHNSSGNNFSVYTFDVVRVMLSDSGTAWCNVTYNSDVDYTVSRTVSLVNNSDNKGGNFTGYTNSTSTTLSAIVSSIGLDAGENIWLWNETTYTWNVYIVGFWTPVVAVHQNSTIFTKVEDTETWTFGGV